MYAVLPALIAPIFVENMRFIGWAEVHADSLQDGHSIPVVSSLSISSEFKESGLGCRCSTRWSARKTEPQPLHSVIKSLNSPTWPLATRTASGVMVGESISTMSP